MRFSSFLVMSGPLVTEAGRLGHTAATQLSLEFKGELLTSETVLGSFNILRASSGGSEGSPPKWPHIPPKRGAPERRRTRNSKQAGGWREKSQQRLFVGLYVLNMTWFGRELCTWRYK